MDGIMIDKWNMRINEATTVIIIKTDNDWTELNEWLVIKIPLRINFISPERSI